MSGLPDPSDKVEPGKEEGSRTRIVHETGCNQILVCFLLAKSPTTGPNVLKIPFSEVTPNGLALEGPFCGTLRTFVGI